MYQTGNSYYAPYQQPAYDTYGRPILPINYEQRIAVAHDLRRQEKEYIDKKLKEKYPSKFALFYSITLIIISLIQIALQIVLIFNNGALYYVGHGIWGGCFGFLMSFFALILISLLIQSFGMAIILASLVLLNGLSFVYYQPSYSKSTKTYNVEGNREMMPISGVMLGLGIIASVLCLVFLIMMCRITKRQTNIINYSNAPPVYTPNPIAAFNNYPLNSTLPPPYSSIQPSTIIPIN